MLTIIALYRISDIVAIENNSSDILVLFVLHWIKRYT